MGEHPESISTDGVHHPSGHGSRLDAPLLKHSRQAGNHGVVSVLDLHLVRTDPGHVEILRPDELRA